MRDTESDAHWVGWIWLATTTFEHDIMIYSLYADIYNSTYDHMVA